MLALSHGCGFFELLFLFALSCICFDLVFRVQMTTMTMVLAFAHGTLANVPSCLEFGFVFLFEASTFQGKTQSQRRLQRVLLQVGCSAEVLGCLSFMSSSSTHLQPWIRSLLAEVVCVFGFVRCFACVSFLCSGQLCQTSCCCVASHSLLLACKL